ncbi:MAG: Glu-tRNA(Gln) amidotransferase GatDE subunit D [Thermoproteota archaeon]|mgnify:CR=1 FL=1|nr:MAG: Glu-tRNA(Gln) amidotransferase GatDE subunit D [Candidatus Korarchaeota archaeon]
MYSPEVEKALESAGAHIGDIIRIQRGSEVYEGILLPRSEYGDPSCIVIKLSSGYNIGVKYTPGTVIKRLRKAAEVGKFPAKKAERKPSLPPVSLIATGGTIGSRVDYVTGGVYMCVKPEELLYLTPELEDAVYIERMRSPFLVASEDLTPDDWKEIAEIAAKELNTDVRGVVITHGTDTMHYTSAALSFMLRNLSKPVALVGAQRSPDRGSFDGAMNLLCAAHYAARSDIAEVAIVMHGESSDTYCYAIRGTKARKMHTSRRDTFRPINDLPLARVWPDGRIEALNTKYRKRGSSEVYADTAFEKRVAIVKAYPGSDPEVIDYYVDKGYRGIVIEGTGFGHTPVYPRAEKLSWLPSIKRAVEESVALVMTSQALYGRTNPYVYRNARVLKQAGVVYVEDMLTEVAYVKLGWVLGHTQDPKEVESLMLTDIAGEISSRTLFNTYLI